MDAYTTLIERFIVDGKLNRNRLTKSREGKLFCLSIKSIYGDISPAESCYLIYHHLTEQPGCKGCGAKTCRFYNFMVGYLIYCSVSCSSKNNGAGAKLGALVKTEAFKKNRNTVLLEKYGTNNMAGLNADKIKQASIEKYGVDHPLKSIEVRQKRDDAVLEKYGVSSILQVDGNTHCC